jgi:hypothetical protein
VTRYGVSHAVGAKPLFSIKVNLHIQLLKFTARLSGAQRKWYMKAMAINSNS